VTTINRIYNFSAGPAVLPLEVLEQAREHLIALPGVGMSILEISHRSKPFDEIIQGAEADMRALAGIPRQHVWRQPGVVRCGSRDDSADRRGADQPG